MIINRPNPELKRRTQQYGHLFSYRYRYIYSPYTKTRRKVTYLFVHRKVMEEYGPLPDFCNEIIERIMENKWMPNRPNHLLINEYNRGQGIMPHVGT